MNWPSAWINEPHRRRLAAQFVQRRRADIRHFLAADTPFPDRLVSESTYGLSPEYKEFAPDIARQHLRSIIAGIDAVRPKLDELAREHGKQLLDSHQRVRHTRGVQHRVEAKLPVDILGLYVFLPI